MATRQTMQRTMSGSRPLARPTTWVGAALLVVIAVIHVAVYVGFQLTVGYPGGLFLLNAAAAIVLAAGIVGGLRLAWHLGALFAAGTIVAFIVVHTIGLPGFYLESWIESVGGVPLGPLSLVVEVAFLVTYALSFAGRRAR
ncbi:MAG: hypothetical protein J2P38_03150 [Candidatus Dormibacteraeota bacterium]|nr:hypothetical protein [Candidatus Dormibacteraeota bacterium]